MPGISDQAPEYFYYTKFLYKATAGTLRAPVLDVEQVVNMTSSDYTYFGLNNTYNAKMVYYYYTIEDVDNIVTPFMNDTV